MRKRIFRQRGLCWLVLLMVVHSYGQGDTIVQPLGVFAKGKVRNNKIALKWAVNDAIIWKKALISGYQVVRTTVLRDGQPIMKDEKVVLHEKLLPMPLEAWRPLVEQDSIAPIIAQALYGEEFQVTNNKGGLTEMMLLNDQNQQRFAFALMAAEQSFVATKAAGWGIEDETALANEKYLYSISLLEPSLALAPSTVYIGLQDKPDTTLPLTPDAVFGNQTVMLIWDHKLQQNLFTAYTIERSEDGVLFTQLNKAAIYSWETKSSAVSYTDNTIKNGVVYYYRIIGIDSFGDRSQPSAVISGKGVDILEYSPQFTSKAIAGEDEMDFEWEFPEEGQAKISHFQILKSDAEDGELVVVKDQIPPLTRALKMKTELKPTNYFTIRAFAHSGTFRSSLPTMVQPIDSIAPLPPIALEGKIDSLGVVKLKWKANTERDLYGYKVFRGNTPQEEFSQLTQLVHTKAEFTDKVDVNSLNGKVYYKLIALDKRYNESDFSSILEIKKPDKIKPTSPVIENYELDENFIKLIFIQSSSDDVKKHILYRRTDLEKNWTTILEFTDKQLSEYKDTSFDSERKYYYIIVAVDESGNESEPSEPFIATPVPKIVTKAITNFDFQVDRKNKNIALFWSAKGKKIVEYQLYKRKKGADFILYRVFPFKDKMRFVDEVLSLGNVYEYALKAFFEDGTSSEIKEISVEY